MANFTVHTPDTAPEGAKPLLEKSQANFGFVPNLHGVLAEAPVALEAYQNIIGSFTGSSLTPIEQDVVYLTVNYENECTYCMAGHSMIARMHKIDAGALDALRAGKPIADARLEALRDFTRKMVAQRGWMSEADVEAFLAAGWSRQNALEVVAGVAAKTLSNYANHLASTPVDEVAKADAWTKPGKAAAAE